MWTRKKKELSNGQTVQSATAKRTIKQNNNDKVDRTCRRWMLKNGLVCMWYKSNQRELDRVHKCKIGPLLIFIWWLEYVCAVRLVVAQCLCCNAHCHFQNLDGSLIFSTQPYFFFLSTGNFYIVSICDVYLSISKMRNTRTNENGSNGPWLKVFIEWNERKIQKNYGNAFRIAIYKMRAHSHRPTTTTMLMLADDDDSMQFIAFGPNKMKRINLNLCKM